jgi:hypothetical protein
MREVILLGTGMQGNLHMTSRHLGELLARGVIVAVVVVIVVIAATFTLEHMGVSTFYNSVIMIPTAILVTLAAIFYAASSKQA